MNNLTNQLSEELKLNPAYVQAVIKLIDEGNTIPFIARYRKEAHGGMDDTTLRNLDDRLKYLRNLEERKEEVICAIANLEKLTPELEKAVRDAKTLSEVEDLYLPYKQKRRTRATIAKEKGLEPLANVIQSQKVTATLEELAADYITDQVPTAADALAGASDIIAENISDSADIRKILRKFIADSGIIISKASKDEDSVYQLYYEFSQPLKKMHGHQVLALNRGEKEGFLKVKIDVEKDVALQLIERNFITCHGEVAEFLKGVIKDSFDRLLFPSLENEARAELTSVAAEGAIANFALNLKPLLLQPPVKGKVTMGLDPGYRMGCKVAVIDANGKVLDTTVVYPTHGDKQKGAAIETLAALIKKHGVIHIAIGNGTASRETENMTVELLKQCPGVSYMVVSEAGASVYSASKLAAEEFPEYDVNLRSAISIARRLEDPLAELVKIDPKAIGVGQYQHDMPQKRLEESLDGVVEYCVNSVGVDVNTASASLLKRVSGLTTTTAANIVTYRETNGGFRKRSDLLKVPKLGAKAYEQCAGFLRVPESENILDNTGVHPESYAVAEKLLPLLGYSMYEKNSAFISKDTGIHSTFGDSAGSIAHDNSTWADIKDRLKNYGEKKAADELGCGLLTLKDIATELAKPGRDPRESLPQPIFKTDLLSISDLKPGMQLTGTVRNVIDFGAFVDIGVHQDGLVHISEIANRFIKHPSEALKVGDDVKVVVLGVDEKKGRISLSIKQAK